MQEKIKEVYYNKKLYTIPIENVKFLNGVDVALLPNNLIVYWSDSLQEWNLATKELEELYFGINKVQLKKLNGEIEMVNIDTNNIVSISENKVAYINIKKFIMYDSKNDVWTELENDDLLVKMYIVLEKNKNDLLYFEKNNII